MKCLKSALSLEPKNANLHGAIAFTQHLNGQLEEAIVGYHISLSFDPNNILYSTLLTKIMMEVTDTDYIYPSNILNDKNQNDIHHPYFSVASIEQELGLDNNDSNLNLDQSSDRIDIFDNMQTANPTVIFKDDTCDGNLGNDDLETSSRSTNQANSDPMLDDSNLSEEQEESYDLDASLDGSSDHSMSADMDL